MVCLSSRRQRHRAHRRGSPCTLRHEHHHTEHLRRPSMRWIRNKARGKAMEAALEDIFFLVGDSGLFLDKLVNYEMVKAASHLPPPSCPSWAMHARPNGQPKATPWVKSKSALAMGPYLIGSGGDPGDLRCTRGMPAGGGNIGFQMRCCCCEKNPLLLQLLI